MPVVTLIAYTPDPIKTVAAAAKLCYSKSDIATLSENLTEEKARDFVDLLSSYGHESPIEHASFTFGIEGVSRTFLAQITRHRLASYSVQSQRYVQKNDFPFIIPPEIENDVQAREEFMLCMRQCAESYEKITQILAKKHQVSLIAEGEDEKSAAKKAQKMAIEDARFVLPGACDTRMIVTMNARSLLNFFKQRCCNRAQWEIRAVAEEMFKLVYAVAPELFKHAGPPCAYGPCTEGGMSCGKMKEMRQKYVLLKEEACKER